MLFLIELELHKKVTTFHGARVTRQTRVSQTQVLKK